MTKEEFDTAVFELTSSIADKIKDAQRAVGAMKNPEDKTKNRQLIASCNNAFSDIERSYEQLSRLERNGYEEASDSSGKSRVF